MAKEFISLEEFMTLRDPIDPTSPLRSYHEYLHVLRRGCRSPGEDILLRYRIAKASYEAYGDDGPPIGTTVVTLNAGHGGGPGVTCTIVHDHGTGYSNDARFICLSRSHSRDAGNSCATKACWWAEFATEDCIDAAVRISRSA